jgi:hypothetical protein
MTAKGAAPIAQSGDSPGLAVEMTLSYRRGGGAVEIALVAQDGSVAPKGWTLTGTTDEPVPIKAASAGPARATIPRERFCSLAHDGKLVATPDGVANAAAPQGPVTFDLAAMDGASALIAEACP